MNISSFLYHFNQLDSTHRLFYDELKESVLVLKKNTKPSESLKKLNINDIIENIRRLNLEEFSPHEIQKGANILYKIAEVTEKRYFSVTKTPLKLINIVWNYLNFNELKTTHSMLKEVAFKLIKEVTSNHNDLYKSSTSYEKGTIPTAYLVPCQKTTLGSGSTGKVYIHRNNVNLVVKKKQKSLYADNENEFKIGSQLNHPNIVRIHQLFVKKYRSGLCKYKLVMDRVTGSTCHSSLKLSYPEAKSVISQAKDCCLYLFEKEIFWRDLNPGNLFINSDKNLVLIDLDGWLHESDPAKRTKILLGYALRFISVVNSIIGIPFSEKLVLPLEFFPDRKKCILTHRSSSTHPKGYWLDNQDQWLSEIEQKITRMKASEMKITLSNYFEGVISYLDKMETLTT